MLVKLLSAAPVLGPSGLFRAVRDGGFEVFVERFLWVVSILFEDFVELQHMVAGSDIAEEGHGLLGIQALALGEFRDYVVHQAHQEMLELVFVETFGGPISHPFLKLAAKDRGRQDDAAPVLGGLVRPPGECHGLFVEPFEVGDGRVRFVSLAWPFFAHGAMVPSGIAGRSARR